MRFKIITSFNIKGCITTTKNGWIGRGIGVSYSYKEDMRFVEINLFIATIALGWLLEENK